MQQYARSLSSPPHSEIQYEARSMRACVQESACSLIVPPLFITSRDEACILATDIENLRQKERGRSFVKYAGKFEEQEARIR